jgi:16S rRNA (guanine1516-N2)-methyltransferase
MTNIIVSFTDSCFKKPAEILAKRINLPLFQLASVNCDLPMGAHYSLCLSADGLSFISHNNKHGAIRCDFVTGSHRHRRNHGGGNGQMIAKAVGVSGKFFPNVLDVTAGLGSDGFVLSSLGCKVQLLERNPIVYSLLKDGLDRARLDCANDDELAAIIARITLTEVNSYVYLDSVEPPEFPDVIYIDPMFPPRKKSAQVKKEMQALHQIVGEDEDASRILEEALKKAIYRVVVKRPTNADYLAMLKPNYSLEGKSTRYDIFAKQKLPK